MKEKNPRVLIILDNDFDSDIRVGNEVNILLKEGFQITVLCFQFDGKEVNLYNEFDVVRILIQRKRKNRLFLVASWTPFYRNFWSKHILKQLQSEKYDLVYSHDLYMIEAVHNALGKFKKKLPFVIDLHEHYAAAVETYSWTKGFPRRQLSRSWNWYKKEKKVLEHPDLCITLSDSFSERLSKLTNRSKDDFFPFPNITPLPALLDLETNLPFNEDDIVFLYYGAIANRRGVFDLFEAFLVTVDKLPNSKLLLIGPVDKADQLKFDSYLKNPKLKESVHHIPWIESKYWRNYAELSDYCLAPFHVNAQHNSGVANKIYQYLQAGKFIIASNCTPQKILINEFKAGVIFKNQDELVQQIIDCSNNLTVFKEQGRNAALQFEQSDFFEKNSKSYVKRLNRLIGRD